MVLFCLAWGAAANQDIEAAVATFTHTFRGIKHAPVASRWMTRVVHLAVVYCPPYAS
jgi:hypothetical protein